MMNKITTHLPITIGCILILAAGCENNTNPIREYTEIVTEPQRAQQMLNRPMPQDDIHAGLVDPAQNMREMANSSPALQSQLDASVATTALTWATPADWKETKGSGMRVVTFTTPEDNPTETTIIALNGNAGGIDANVSRWARQINASIRNDSEMSTFINQQSTVKTQDNLEAQIVDFTSLTDDEAQSMLAAIISTDTSQIFIKMTGSDQAVTSEKHNFLALVKSLNTTSAE